MLPACIGLCRSASSAASARRPRARAAGLARHERDHLLRRRADRRRADDRGRCAVPRHRAHDDGAGTAPSHVQRRDRALPQAAAGALAARARVPAVRPGVRRGDPPLPHRRRSATAAGATSWARGSRCGSCWQVACMLGFFTGNLIPAAWSLEFAVPLCFIALVAPLFANAPSILAAITAGIAVARARAPADEAQPYRRGPHRHPGRHAGRPREGTMDAALKLWAVILVGGRAQLPVAAVVHRVLRAPVDAAAARARASLRAGRDADRADPADGRRRDAAGTPIRPRPKCRGARSRRSSHGSTHSTLWTLGVGMVALWLLQCRRLIG